MLTLTLTKKHISAFINVYDIDNFDFMAVVTSGNSAIKNKRLLNEHSKNHRKERKERKESHRKNTYTQIILIQF